MAIGVPFFCIIGMEHYLSASSSWRSRQTLCDYLGFLQSFLVEYRMKEFVQFLRLASEDGSLLINHAFVEQVHGNLDHSSTCALAVTCLQEPQLSFLYGEFHVLHIVIVLLQLVLECIQFLVEFGHSLFHGGIFGDALFLGDACTLCPAL